MDSLTCIIVDDDVAHRERLAGLLQKIAKVKILASTGKPDIAIKKILELKPDIVFSEVELPQKSGFELARRVREQNVWPKFIFVSQYSQYAIKALRNGAYDFLVKPVDIEELKKMLEE